MLTPRRLAAAALVVAGLACPAAVAQQAVSDRASGQASGQAPLRAPVRASERSPDRSPFGAECRTSIQGSRVTASCHNPYPDSDMVQLHIECRRWWDPDVDGKPVEAGPARTVVLSGRCWMEIRDVWVTHDRRGT
ncbi:hypothetical protein [Streptomyces sp. KR80]|uniref:hypothetical protein n=1 Tax=Streptomyces sp. KR80 TaxID=3457426 RepID=UPI003FD16794